MLGWTQAKSWFTAIEINVNVSTIVLACSKQQ